MTPTLPEITHKENKMTKIIIHIEDGINELKAVDFVRDVINGGMVSKTAGRKHYCHATAWHKSGHVVTVLNKREGLNTFYVYKKEPVT